MATHELRVSLRIPLPIDEVFPFFSKAENLGRITPPELGFRIVTPLPIEMKEGVLIDYRISLYGIPMRWQSRITRWRPPFAFTDEQARGPYAEWIHSHRFAKGGDGATLMEDHVRYRLPFAPLGDIAHPLVRRQLSRIFGYRQVVVQRLLLSAHGGAAA